MNRSSALNVLIASNHADTRVALSWMLRQSFPDALVSKAESIQETVKAAGESPACVIVDALLPGFVIGLSALSQSLQQSSVPMIVFDHSAGARQANSDVEPGPTAWLDRSSVNVRAMELAVSKAVQLSTMTGQIESLERDLAATREELAASSKTTSDHRAAEPAPHTRSTETGLPLENPLQQNTGHDSATAGSVPSTPESPRLLKSGLEVSTEEERELAGRVQKDLMPPGSPLVEGFDIAGLSIPAETTGGDYYDYLPMADDLLCISIGECSGRGLAPALLMASLRAYLRLLVTSTTDVSDVLSRANTLITEDIGEEEFIVTLLLIQIDCRTRTLQYASAGQQAFFFDRDGNVDVLHSTGMPLGLRDETVILEGASRKIRAGEILLLASDGVQKMMSDSGELFGTDRMLELVKANRNLPSMIIANYLRKACTDFASPQFRSDDVTIVIVKGDDS